MGYVKKIFGILYAILLYALPSTRNALRHITNDAFKRASRDAKRDSVCYLMCGFSMSGKTTWLQKMGIHGFTVTSQELHSALNSWIPALNDGTAVTGRGYWPRQVYTRLLRDHLFARAMAQGVTIVSDSCNLDRKTRQEFFQRAKRFGYRTKLIWVHCSEAELLKRLDAADAERKRRNEQPTWVKLYQDIQRVRFQQPTAVEADEVIDILS